MKILLDTKNQPYVEWEERGGDHYGGRKRAWVRTPNADAPDWLGAGTRYVSVGAAGRSPSGGPLPGADFLVFAAEPDEIVLERFVRAVCRATGCRLA